MKEIYALGLAATLTACSAAVQPVPLETQPNQLEVIITPKECDPKKSTPASGLTKVNAPEYKFLQTLKTYIPPEKKGVAFMPVELGGFRGTASIIAQYEEGRNMPIRILIVGKGIAAGLEDYQEGYLSGEMLRSYKLQMACLNGQWSTYYEDFAALEKLGQDVYNKLPQSVVSEVIEKGAQVQRDLELEKNVKGFLENIVFAAKLK